MGLFSTPLAYILLAPKYTEFGKITQNNGHTPFKVIHGHRFWYQTKPIYLRFRQGVSLFNTLVRGKLPNSRLRNLALRNQKHSSIVWCKMCFDYLEPSRRSSRRTDRHTNRTSISNRADYRRALKMRCRYNFIRHQSFTVYVLLVGIGIHRRMLMCTAWPRIRHLLQE